MNNIKDQKQNTTIKETLEHTKQSLVYFSEMTYAISLCTTCFVVFSKVPTLFPSSHTNNKQTTKATKQSQQQYSLRGLRVEDFTIIMRRKD